MNTDSSRRTSGCIPSLVLRTGGTRLAAAQRSIVGAASTLGAKYHRARCGSSWRAHVSRILVCVILISVGSCTTVRLTPSAAKYLQAEGGVDAAQNDLDTITRKIGTEKQKIDAVIQYTRIHKDVRDKIIELLGLEGDVKAATSNASSQTTAPSPDTITLAIEAYKAQLEAEARISLKEAGKRANAENLPTRRDAEAAFAQRVVELWWSGAFDKLDSGADINLHFNQYFGTNRASVVTVLPEPPVPADKPQEQTAPQSAPSVPTAARLRYLEDQQRDRQLDVRQLRAVATGTWDYFVSGSTYFSIEPMVAIRPNFEAVAVPSIAINWRPWDLLTFTGDTLKDLQLSGAMSAIGFQLTFGGALNPSGSDNSNAEGALGCGMSIPVADIGAFSFGCVWIGDGSNTHAAPYISLTLGDFGKSTAGAGK